MASLLPAGHTQKQVTQLCGQSQGVAKVTGGRLNADRQKSSRRFLYQHRSRLPTSESSATFITSQDFSIVSSGGSQEHVAEPFGGRGSSPSLPQCGSAPASHHVARQVAIRGSHSETPMDKRVRIRKSEERKIPQRRSPWGDRKKSQRGTSASR